MTAYRPGAFRAMMRFALTLSAALALSLVYPPWQRRRPGPPSSSRVLRGGSFLNDARYARSASRNSGVPTHRPDVGFRVARTYR